MATRRKRKTTRRKRRGTGTTRKYKTGLSGRCQIKSINGKRRRICRDTKGRIKSNTAVRSGRKRKSSSRRRRRR